MFRRRSGATLRTSATTERVSGRRRRHWTAWLMVLLLVLGGVLSLRWLLAPEQFPLQRIAVDGLPAQIGETELRVLLDEYLGRNLLRLNLTELRQRLLDEPWIVAAELERHWPDQLVVALQPRQAVAYWGDDALLDTAGQVFRPARIPDDEYWPRLHGPADQAAMLLDSYRSFSQQLSVQGLVIEKLQLDDYGNWRLTLLSGVVVELGSRDWPNRLQRFMALYPRVLQPHLSELAAIDLRYPDGAALRWIELPDAEPLPAGGSRAPERLQQLAAR